MSYPRSIANSENTPRFVGEFKKHLRDKQSRIAGINDIIQEVLLLAATRGFNDHEFSLLLDFYRNGSTTAANKRRLLSAIIPANVAPSTTMEQFMVWFIDRYKKNRKNAGSILQWLIALLENGQVEESVIDPFYFDFFTMLQFRDLVKYACMFLCTLTKPEDVSESTVGVVSKKILNDSNDKYILAALNVFKGYKPHFVSNAVKKMDINKILKSVPQSMDFFIKLNSNRGNHLEKSLTLAVLPPPGQVKHVRQEEGFKRTSTLIPYPTYNFEGLDKAVAVHPKSIEEAFKNFAKVAIPQNVMSLLRDEVGLFIITHKGFQLHEQLSHILFQTLQNVFIYKETPADDSDRLHLLSRVYQLENFMQQGIPSVSIFLSGYLLNWDGLDYRLQILNLIEFATFDSFNELSTNILRPLYCLFVSYDAVMKEHILQTLTALINNMFLGNISRKARGLRHPFLLREPLWLQDPMSMLQPLIAWVEGLVKVGLCLENESVGLLLQSITFYEWMIELEETQPSLPLWTVVTQGIVYRSLFTLPAEPLDRVCRLLIRYYKIFLPNLRQQNPEFYVECSTKIEKIAKYVKELTNLIWHGKAFSEREEGVIVKEIPQELLSALYNELRDEAEGMDLDRIFDLQRNLLFLPFVLAMREKHEISTKQDYFYMVNFFCPNIGEFIQFFAQT